MFKQVSADVKAVFFKKILTVTGCNYIIIYIK